MTAQISDRIWLEGENRSLCTLPLSVLFNAMPKRPRFVAPNTANRRGYQATWKIKNDRLFLVALLGRLDPAQHFDADRDPETVKGKKSWCDVISALDVLPVGAKGERISQSQHLLIDDSAGEVDPKIAGEITIEQLMKTDAGTPLPADWYSGLLRVPTGATIEYVHGGFLSMTEFDLIIEIDRGEVRRRWTIDNRPGLAARKREHAEHERLRQRVRQSILALKPLVDLGDETAFRAALQNPRQSVAQTCLDLGAPFRQGKGGAEGRAAADEFGHGAQALLFEALTYFFLRHFLGSIDHAEILSQLDIEAKSTYLAAKAEFDRAKMAVDGALTIRKLASDASMEIGALPLAAFFRLEQGVFDCLDESLHEVWSVYEDEFGQAAAIATKAALPEDHAELRIWAESTMRSAETLIATGAFARLGVAAAIIYDFADQEESDDDVG
jgi:hypothetical protein